MIPLFDLHADTLLNAYNEKKNIFDCDLHISLQKAKVFSPYIQVMAIWSDYKLNDDEAFQKALKIINFYSKLGLNFSTSLSQITNQNFILAIEDARLLNNDISRLDVLHYLGVRVLTLNWKDISCIGGAYNTELGLTDFGKAVVQRCAELNIIVDLSHSSRRTFEDTFEIASKLGFSPIASHSNSFSVCNHTRNITNEQFIKLIDAKSLLGISLVCEHLGKGASFDTIIKHIEHFLSLGGENTLSLGCDFDGVDILPWGINSISDLSSLYSLFVFEFGEMIAQKIFFKNAFNYFTKHL